MSTDSNHFYRAISMFSLLIALVAAEAQSAAAEVRSVTVAGKRILLDGKEIPIRGFIFQAFVEDADQLRMCRDVDEYCERHLEARDFYFGRGKYTRKGGLKIAEEFGANTIRFNLSQAALDPEGEYYSEKYLDEIVEAVSLARSKGFAVIVCLFDARNTNAPQALQNLNPPTPLDDAVTFRAARVLAREFGRDTGVMIELLNEPWSPTRRKFGWRLWANGGTIQSGRFAGRSFVGVNTIIRAISEDGAQNVVIVQGLGASFKGYPENVVDPLGRVAYSVHPFLSDGNPKRLDWDGNFGKFASKHPFFITAWNSPARQDWCEKFGLQEPSNFLGYIKKKKMGLVVYALDVPRTVLTDFRKNLDRLTAYGKTCSDGGAAGELVRKFFAEPAPQLPE